MKRSLDEMNCLELFDHLAGDIRTLKNMVKTRRRRERTMELTTDIFMTINAIAKRVAHMTFSEGPVTVEDEDDEGEERGVPMGELFRGADDAEVGVEAEQIEDVDELRQIIRGLQLSRLDYFKAFLNYLCKGCRQEIDVTKRVLAIVRRVNPALLQQFGLSQADVGRKFGETRAAVSMREKQRVEKLLKASGAKGILSNGARGHATSLACARAAKGNTNRRRKHTTL